MASLVRSDLRGACLRGTDLTGSDMTEVDLREGLLAMPDNDGNIVPLNSDWASAGSGGADLAAPT